MNNSAPIPLILAIMVASGAFAQQSTSKVNDDAETTFACYQLGTSLDDHTLARRCDIALEQNRIDGAFRADIHDALSLYYRKHNDRTSELRHRNASINHLITAAKLNGRGFFFLKGGDSKSALADFSQSLLLKPKADIQAQALMGRALVNEEIGEWEKAIADAEEADRLRSTQVTRDLVKRLRSANR